jgi:hypothetical protein
MIMNKRFGESKTKAQRCKGVAFADEACTMGLQAALSKRAQTPSQGLSSSQLGLTLLASTMPTYSATK